MKRRTDKCWLKTEQKQCCCNCQWHARDCYHCTTAMDLKNQIEKLTKRSTCICDIQKGWACLAPEFIGRDGVQRIHTNWPEHSIGCEMYSAREKVEKEEQP